MREVLFLCLDFTDKEAEALAADSWPGLRGSEIPRRPGGGGGGLVCSNDKGKCSRDLIAVVLRASQTFSSSPLALFQAWLAIRCLPLCEQDQGRSLDPKFRGEGRPRRPG